MKRNHTGHRVGECHHRTKDNDDVVARARELKATGMTWNELHEQLHIPVSTLRNWCNFETRTV